MQWSICHIDRYGITRNGSVHCHHTQVSGKTTTRDDYNESVGLSLSIFILYYRYCIMSFYRSQCAFINPSV
jgi:hypothetical protein